MSKTLLNIQFRALSDLLICGPPSPGSQRVNHGKIPTAMERSGNLSHSGPFLTFQLNSSVKKADNRCCN